ncbi:hypothetical protein Gogos_022223 [Gossypium gossypioides]|uniref:Uncharacterized protein n=1 Tax=Gossypium gossypioides TaxID=34282 RepID=A0A7J9D020_GOSGO|nr:hypothetical protein [Gossypium gossypioides]
MKKGFLDKVEDNAAVRAWSETTQHEKGDSLAKGYISELWDFTFDRVYSRAINVPTFFKKRLMNITGMNEQWVTARIQQKGDSKCIPWKSLKDIILAYPE